LKGTRTVLRGGGGSDAPNLPDLILIKHIRIPSLNLKEMVQMVGNYNFIMDYSKMEACYQLIQ
jgi:hypothetical protein